MTLRDATPLVDPLKAKKSAEEIDADPHGRQMQDEILAKAAGHIKPGKKEFEADGLLAATRATCSAARPDICWARRRRRAGRPTSARGRSRAAQMREGDVIYLAGENTGPGRHDRPMSAATTCSARRRRSWSTPSASAVEAQDNTVRCCSPARRAARFSPSYNPSCAKHGMPKETRLHCHGQGYDVVERPMIRHDETWRSAPA